jgi:LmbE family N-acetylglucosaminyl deacetylase
MKKNLVLLLISCSVINYLFAQAPKSYTSSEILLQLKKLNTVGSVLYIAAHPDDENTRLITYLANEKCLRTGYLSLTRGDGGQNLIGSEQGIELGMIRTQELLAARRIDGGEQFFTRAYDFGYSKNPEETFTKWNHDSILSDVVWVIRNFRPDIIITRFATDGSGGHGHHTASAILAEEAFDAAADPTRFPEQLQFVGVWQTRRMFYNSAARFFNPAADLSKLIKLDVGGYNPLLGKSYGEIAAESRSMHKSQGFGSAKQRGESFEYFKPIKGDTAGLKNIFEGIDFTWKRVKAGENIGNQITKAIKEYNTEQPDLISKQLTEIYNTINEKDNPYQANSLGKIILNCNGYFRESIADKPNYSIDEKIKIADATIIRINNSILKGYSFNSFNRDTTIYIPKKITPLYWTENAIQNNMFVLNDKNNLLHNNESQPYILSGYDFMQNAKGIRMIDQLQYKWVDPEKGELYRPLVITPPVMLNLTQKSFVFTDEKPKEIKVIVKAGKDNIQTKATAKLPQGWTMEPAFANINLPKKGDEQIVSFFIKPSNNSTIETIQFTAEIDGVEYTKGIKEIKYDHIPVQTWFPEAEAKLVKVEVKKTFNTVGYIQGAGDEIPASLEQMGYKVFLITDEQLQNGNLNEFPAIVLGVRAFNTNEKLQQYKQRVFDYVKNGGNLIVQYNTNSFAGPLKEQISPVPFKLSRDRVTIEEAPVGFLLPEHPVLNFPNKITNVDFDGWIQERGIYFASEIDSSFQCPLSMNDPGEKPNKGSLIIAKYGKGNYIYTGLAFFRELPAGVPGAYRLFANILSLKNGK